MSRELRGYILSKPIKTLKREINNRTRDPIDFLERGLNELKLILRRNGGRISGELDFHGADIVYQEVKEFIADSKEFGVDVNPYDEEHERLVEVFEKEEQELIKKERKESLRLKKMEKGNYWCNTYSRPAVSTLYYKAFKKLRLGRI